MKHNWSTTIKYYQKTINSNHPSIPPKKVEQEKQGGRSCLMMFNNILAISWPIPSDQKVGQIMPWSNVQYYYYEFLINLLSSYFKIRSQWNRAVWLVQEEKRPGWPFVWAKIYPVTLLKRWSNQSSSQIVHTKHLTETHHFRSLLTYLLDGSPRPTLLGLHIRQLALCPQWCF